MTRVARGFYVFFLPFFTYCSRWLRCEFDSILAGLSGLLKKRAEKAPSAFWVGVFYVVEYIIWYL